MKTKKTKPNKKEKRMKVEVVLPEKEYSKLMKVLNGKYDTIAYFS